MVLSATIDTNFFKIFPTSLYTYSDSGLIFFPYVQTVNQYAIKIRPLEDYTFDSFLDSFWVDLDNPQLEVSCFDIIANNLTSSAPTVTNTSTTASYTTATVTPDSTGTVKSMNIPTLFYSPSTLNNFDILLNVSTVSPQSFDFYMLCTQDMIDVSYNVLGTIPNWLSWIKVSGTPYTIQFTVNVDEYLNGINDDDYSDYYVDQYTFSVSQWYEQNQDPDFGASLDFITITFFNCTPCRGDCSWDSVAGTTCNSCDTTVTGDHAIPDGLICTFCGNDHLDYGEECDNGGDTGCTDCSVDTGYECSGKYSSICKPICGDGLILGSEECDTGDEYSCGCYMCNVMPGWECSGEPSVCEPSTCGNGVIDDGESCDDYNIFNGDGCSCDCQVECGWSCSLDFYKTSVCVTHCGDGIIAGNETCDDGETLDESGCLNDCSGPIPEAICNTYEAKVKCGSQYYYHSDCPIACGNQQIDNQE